MQAAINTHRMARNLPCVNRYVLQVSQMVLETFAMLSCTGRALVCWYCTSPKAAPTRHTRMPRYISVTPLMPASPPKWTVVRSGMTMSDSLAYPPVQLSREMKKRRTQKQCFLFFINSGARDYRRNVPGGANTFFGESNP